MPNFLQKLPIWPGYHSFPKTRDPKDNKKPRLAFSQELSRKLNSAHRLAINNYHYDIWFYICQNLSIKYFSNGVCLFLSIGPENIPGRLRKT